MQKNQIKEVLAKAVKLGFECHRKRELEQAEKLFLKALNIDPNHAEALNGLGVIAIDFKRYSSAVKIYTHALTTNENNLTLLYGLGNAYRFQQLYKKAIECYLKAIEVNKKSPEIYVNLAICYAELADHYSAIDACDKAIKLDPRSVKAHNNKGYSYRYLGQLNKAVECFKSAISYDPSFVGAHSNLLFAMAQSNDFSSQEYVTEAKRYGVAVSKGKQKYSKWNCGDKFKVGFVAADFNNHVVSKLIEEALEKLSHLDIDLIAYSNGKKVDHVTERLQTIFSGWNDITLLTDEAVASKVYSDGINILIDMSGHSALNRLPVFAYKPAPVQISWLGFFASTGLPEMDYFAVDKVAGPDRNDSAFTEELWQLKSSQCLRTPDIDRDIHYLPMKDAGVFTFGCVNRVDKMSDDVIDIWVRILTEMPESRFYSDSWMFKWN